MRWAAVEEFLSWANEIGPACVAVCLIASVTKIIIVRMVIKDVPPELRPEVLKASSSLFFRRKRRALPKPEDPKDGPSGRSGRKPKK
jgi:hypothetical protein